MKPGDPPEWAERAWPKPPPRRGAKIGGPAGLLRGGPEVDLDARGLGFLFQIPDDLGVRECGARLYLLGGDGAFFVHGRVDGGLPSLDDVCGFNEV